MESEEWSREWGAGLGLRRIHRCIIDLECMMDCDEVMPVLFNIEVYFRRGHSFKGNVKPILWEIKLNCAESSDLTINLADCYELE